RDVAGRDVGDRDAGRAAGALAVLVGDGDADAVDRGGARAGVVEVLVAGGVAEHTGGQAQGGVAAAVAPADHHRVRVLRPRVGEAARRRRRAVLVPCAPLFRSRDVAGRDVGDRDAGRAAGALAVLVGDGDADAVDRGGARAGVVEVL